MSVQEFGAACVADGADSDFIAFDEPVAVDDPNGVR